MTVNWPELIIALIFLIGVPSFLHYVQKNPLKYLPPSAKK